MRVSALLRRSPCRSRNRLPARSAHSMRVSALLRHLTASIQNKTPAYRAHSMRVSALLRPRRRCSRRSKATMCPFHAGFSAAAALFPMVTLLSWAACPFHAGFSAAAAEFLGVEVVRAPEGAHSMRVSALLRPRLQRGRGAELPRVPIPCGFQRCCGPALWPIKPLFRVWCPFHAGFSAAAATRLRWLQVSVASRAHSMRVSALLRPFYLNLTNKGSWSGAHSMRVSALLRPWPPGEPSPGWSVPIPCGFQRCCGPREPHSIHLSHMSAHSMRVSALLRR